MTLTKAMELVNWHFHDDDGIAADATVKEAWDVIRNYVTRTVSVVCSVNSIYSEEGE